MIPCPHVVPCTDQQDAQLPQDGAANLQHARRADAAQDQEAVSPLEVSALHATPEKKNCAHAVRKKRRECAPSQRPRARTAHDVVALRPAPSGGHAHAETASVLHAAPSPCASRRTAPGGRGDDTKPRAASGGRVTARGNLLTVNRYRGHSLAGENKDDATRCSSMATTDAVASRQAPAAPWGDVAEPRQTRTGVMAGQVAP